MDNYIAMIKTVLSFIYVIVSMIFLLPFGLLSLIFYVLGLRKLMKLIIYRLAQGWAIAIIFFVGCNAVVRGRENIPKKGGICFVGNHCGFFDIALLLAYCGRPFGFVAKKELLFVPFLNAWIYMLGGLFIDRLNVRKAIRTINKGVARIKKGGGMVIFPEGHRSKGRGLLPFHAGSLKLATQAGAVIVPVAIKGSYDVFEKNNRVVSTTVNISFLEVIDTSALPSEEKKQALCDRIFTIIESELESNSAEGEKEQEQATEVSPGRI